MHYTVTVVRPEQTLTLKVGDLVATWSVVVDKQPAVMVLYRVSKPWFFTKWFKKS